MKLMTTVMPILLCIFGLLSLPNEVSALVRTSDEKLTVTPVAPEAFSTVDVRLVAATAMPTGSRVQWFVDGTEQTNYLNSQSIPVKLGEIGKITNVLARITSPGANTEESSATIIPSRLDVVIAANSRVPSFYQGRSLPSGGSTISAQAFLFGENSAPYTYHWQVNGQDVSNGVGKASNQITFTPGLDSQMAVEVTVRNKAGELVGQKRTVVPLVEPQVYLYENNPLHGLVPNVLRNPFYFLNDEITLHAEPYFFSGSAQDWKVEWNIDSSGVASDQNPLELSLIKTLEEGQAVVKVDFLNTTNYLESGSASLNLNY